MAILGDVAIERLSCNIMKEINSFGERWAWYECILQREPDTAVAVTAELPNLDIDQTFVVTGLGFSRAGEGDEWDPGREISAATEKAIAEIMHKYEIMLGS